MLLVWSVVIVEFRVSFFMMVISLVWVFIIFLLCVEGVECIIW